MDNKNYSRVRAMVMNEHNDWNLSGEDLSALRHVLGLVNVLADRLAGYTGGTVPQEIKSAAKAVENGL